MSSEPGPLTVSTLFEKFGERLELAWIAGTRGGERPILPELPGLTEHDKTGGTSKSMAGYLNLIHPHQLQIIGDTEISYLSRLNDNELIGIIDRLMGSGPTAIFLAVDCTPPPRLLYTCNRDDVPLFSSKLTARKLSNLLSHLLNETMAEEEILHGVFMEVMGTGVLITGPSGVGKSELALELIARGHKLIADDAARFSRTRPDTLTGSCPLLLRDYLEVRGLGIINVRRIYGDMSLRERKILKLIVRLETMNREELLKLDRLEGSYLERRILDVSVGEITLPVTPGRNLAVLLECAVRNHDLRTRGYNAAEEFSARQMRFITEGEDD